VRRGPGITQVHEPCGRPRLQSNKFAKHKKDEAVISKDAAHKFKQLRVRQRSSRDALHGCIDQPLTCLPVRMRPIPQFDPDNVKTVTDIQREQAAQKAQQQPVAAKAGKPAVNGTTKPAAAAGAKGGKADQDEDEDDNDDNVESESDEDDGEDDDESDEDEYNKDDDDDDDDDDMEDDEEDDDEDVSDAESDAESDIPAASGKRASHAQPSASAGSAPTKLTKAQAAQASAGHAKAVLEEHLGKAASHCMYRTTQLLA